MYDASLFVGHWAFSTMPTISAASLIPQLRAAGITGGAFSPVEAVLAPEPMAANRRLFDALQAARSQGFAVTAVPIIDPSLPGWEDHLAACREMGGPILGAIKIVPNYHDYALDSSPVDALARQCAARGIGLCVQVRMEDERSHHPLMRVPAVAPAAVAAVAARHPSLPILVCGAYLSELDSYRACPRVSVELSFVESGFLLRDARERLGGDRLLLGTHAPLHMIAASVAKLTSDDLDADTYARISTSNFRRFFSTAQV